MRGNFSKTSHSTKQKKLEQIELNKPASIPGHLFLARLMLQEREREREREREANLNGEDSQQVWEIAKNL